MKSLFCLLIISILCLSGFDLAQAELSGVAEWRYADYEQKRNGDKVIDANTFNQQYSLMWEKSGLLNGGRGGQYDLALGAEWSAFDSEVNGENYDLDTFKVLYRGDMLVAPGGLPFRMHLYSYDQHQSQFLDDTYQAAQSTLLNPGITTDIANGQHLSTGATIFVGIRNGSYLGRYRDVLSQVPRLLIDYRELYVKDTEGDTPQHYRERNLAFVSLNKKDNWFHYRYLDFKDYEDSNEDYVEKTYLLGTIDHQQIRRWINMTNWIQVSADGSYTTTDRVQTVTNPVTKRYDFNLFSRYNRSNWDASNFLSFQRISQGSRLSKYIDVPFFANGEYDRNTSWRYQFIGTSDRETSYTGSRPEVEENDAYMAARIETFRQNRYILSPMLEVEAKGGDVGDGYAVRGTMEAYSNSRYNPKYELFGSYSLARFSGNSADTSDDNDIDSWEQEVIGRVDTNLNALVRVGAEQRLIYSSGSTDQNVTLHIQPRSNDPLEGTLEEVRRRENKTLRSTTKLRGEFKTTWRLNNALELVLDYIDTDKNSEHQIIARHSLSYDWRSLSLRMTNELVDGHDPSYKETGNALVYGARSGKIDRSFENLTSASYSPGRAWEITSRLNFAWDDADVGSTTDTDFREIASYNFYTVNGLVRKLAMLRQEFRFERFVDIDDEHFDGVRFSLLGEYYPTRRTLLGGSVRFDRTDPGQDSYIYYLTAGINFEKLQVRFEYEYGTDDDQDEQRWEVNVRKTF